MTATIESLLAVILTIVEAFALMVSYSWFIKPVFTELPDLNLVQSYGILFFLGLVFFGITPNLSLESDENADSVLKLIYLCLMILMAFCFYLLFPI